MTDWTTLDRLPLDRALNVWNEGFQGYYVDMQMDLAVYITRLHREELSPEHSVVLLDEGKPIGFTLNGIREQNGVLTAWNGGTAVLPEYRDRKLGRILLEQSIRLYREAGVKLATLEAFEQNARAIALYERFGYRGRGVRVFHGRPAGAVPPGLAAGAPAGLSIREIDLPAAESAVPFYRGGRPWQTHWRSARDGRCLVAALNGELAGYLPVRRAYSAAGELSALLIYPGGLKEEAPEAVAGALLAEALRGGEACAARTLHMPGHGPFAEALERAGFRPDSRLLYMELEL